LKKKVFSSTPEERSAAQESFPSSENTCIVCGAVIPEGEIVCVSCESGSAGSDGRATRGRAWKKTVLGLLFGKGGRNGKK
jgi:hypothetical protein